MLGVPCVLREAYLVVWVWIDIKSSLYWWRTSLGPRIYEMLISAMFTAGFWFWSIPMFLGALHTHCFTERPLVFRSHPLRPLRDIIGWSAPGGPSFWLLESLLPKNTRFRWSCFAPIAGAIWWCPWSGSHFQWVSSIQGATCSGLRDEADASLSVTWRSFSLLGSIFPLLVQGEWHPTITHFSFWTEMQATLMDAWEQCFCWCVPKTTYRP